MFKSLNEIRYMFIDFFKSKNHHFLKSSSLVSNDNSLLFTNAGMNQFKNVFLGLKKNKYKNIVTIQRCLRVGGKNNDLKNIGYTFRHNTFFEMMGNFSFDSYFKELSIIYAWELLTSKNLFSLSKKNIIITVHINDKESYDIWVNKIKIPLSNIFLIGNNNLDIDINSDNFWKMSKYGPCGYSTEIYYNINNIKDNKDFILYKDTNRYLEIWNLVFVEYNIEKNNNINFLPYKSVDTGMGLERITSIIQNVNSNYYIDIFLEIKIYISKFIYININSSNEYIFNIISDHIRSIIYLIIDGVLPSNEYRGYVLRKIIRRTLTYIKLLKIKDLILYNLIYYIKEIFYKFYLINPIKFIKIKNIVKIEEEKFFKTLYNSLEILNSYILKINNKNKFLKGDIIFLLYDTYGLPLDIIIDVCNYNKINMDIKKFNNLLEIQKNKSKLFLNFNKNKININIINKFNKTNFFGYLYKKYITKVIGILNNNISVNSVNKYDNNVIIILNDTVLFPESGGQKGDKGYLLTKDKLNKFIINDTKLFENYILHIGFIDYGKICINDIVEIKYDFIYRKQISCNHTATHILFYCLKKILCNKIVQCGSCIKNNYFTFDFLYKKSLDNSKLFKLIKMVNKVIWKNIFLYQKFLKNLNIKKNFLFLNNNNNLRIISFKNINNDQYCCGTHVLNTNEIGFFFIINSYSISNKIKRIKACTNIFALKYINKNFFYLKKISNYLSINKKEVYNKIINIIEKQKKLKKKNNSIISILINYVINNIKNNDIINYLNFNFLIKNINICISDKNILFLILNKLKIIYKLSIIVIYIFFKFKKYFIVFTDLFIIKNIHFNWLKLFVGFKKDKNIFKNKNINIEIFFNNNNNNLNKKIYFKKIINFIKYKLFIFKNNYN